MGKIHILRVDELNQMIENNLMKINEIDGKTLSCVANVSIDAMNNIQSGQEIKKINKEKSVTYDSQITKADELYPRAVQSFLNPYKDLQFMFFAYKRLGNVVHLLFSVKNIKKLSDGQAILSGDVVFGNEQLNGDIVVDFINNKVFYKHKSNNYKYTLEPDRRTSEQWTFLLDELQKALNSRIDRG